MSDATEVKHDGMSLLTRAKAEAYYLALAERDALAARLRVAVEALHTIARGKDSSDYGKDYATVIRLSDLAVFAITEIGPLPGSQEGDTK